MMRVRGIVAWLLRGLAPDPRHGERVMVAWRVSPPNDTAWMYRRKLCRAILRFGSFVVLTCYWGAPPYDRPRLLDAARELA